MPLPMIYVVLSSARLTNVLLEIGSTRPNQKRIKARFPSWTSGWSLDLASFQSPAQRKAVVFADSRLGLPVSRLPRASNHTARVGQISSACVRRRGNARNRWHQAAPDGFYDWIREDRLLAQRGSHGAGGACLLCPGSSDINLFRYGKGIINLDAEVPDGAFNLSIPSKSCTARKLPVRR